MSGAAEGQAGRTLFSNQQLGAAARASKSKQTPAKQFKEGPAAGTGVASSVLRGSISTKRGAGGIQQYVSQSRRQGLPENAFKGTDKEGQTFSGSVCLSTLSEGVRPPPLAAGPPQSKDRASRGPGASGRVLPKSHNVSVVHGQAVDVSHLQSDIYKIYVQDSQAAATRLEMHKAQSHLTINAMRPRVEKPFSPKNSEAAYHGLPPGTAASGVSQTGSVKPSSKKSLGNAQPTLKNSGHLRKMAANAVASQLNNSSAFANVASVIESYGAMHSATKYKSRRRRAIPAPPGASQDQLNEAAQRIIRESSATMADAATGKEPFAASGSQPSRRKFSVRIADRSTAQKALGKAGDRDGPYQKVKNSTLSPASAASRNRRRRHHVSKGRQDSAGGFEASVSGPDD